MNQYEQLATALDGFANHIKAASVPNDEATITAAPLTVDAEQEQGAEQCEEQCEESEERTDGGMMIAGYPAKYQKRGDFFAAMALSPEGRLHIITTKRSVHYGMPVTQGEYSADGEVNCHIIGGNSRVVRKTLQAFADNLRKSNLRRYEQAKRAKERTTTTTTTTTTTKETEQ